MIVTTQLMPVGFAVRWWSVDGRPQERLASDLDDVRRIMAEIDGFTDESSPAISEPDMGDGHRTMFTLRDPSLPWGAYLRPIVVDDQFTPALVRAMETLNQELRGETVIGHARRTSDGALVPIIKRNPQ